MTMQRQTPQTVELSEAQVAYQIALEQLDQALREMIGDTDPVRAIELYQFAINNYVALGALENATAMLDVCGSRNFTME